MNILIIGAGGNIGQPLVKRLLSTGAKPVLGVRNREKAFDMWRQAVDLRDFDWAKPETFAPALANLQRVFFIAGHPDPVPSVKLFLEAAVKAGIRQIVFSSGRTTGDVPGKPLSTIEQLLRESGLNWTILRPGWFMQNFIGWLGGSIRRENKLFLPAADAKTAFVDVRDVGEVAANCLLEEDHSGKVYDLTSDEALDHHAVCALISRAKGERVTYVPQPRADFVRTMMERGWTEAAANYTADLYEYVVSGKEEDISPDIEKVLKRPPRRLQAFTEEFASWF